MLYDALTITQATKADADTVYALLVGAAEWLRARGINQWGHYLDGTGRADLEQAITSGEVYLALLDGAPVATISLQMEQSDWDRTIWGPDEGEAAYVHRLAISRAHSGAGVGALLLDWAESHARSAGKRLLRLDCVGHNQPLNAYYAKRFTLQGQSPNIGMMFSKYERVL